MQQTKFYVNIMIGNIYISESDATNKEIKLNVDADDYKKKL